MGYSLENEINNLDYETVEEIYKKYVILQNAHVESKDNSEKLNLLYERNKEQFARVILTNCIENKADKLKEVEATSEDIDRYVPVFSKILDGTLKEQNRNFSNLRILNNAYFSTVFQIGNKILKVGVPRTTYKIPNHKRVLQPFIRENFETVDGKPFACIELSEEVRPVKGPIHIREMMSLYNELRRDGILWADAKPANLGYLNRKNLPYYKGENFENNPEFVGLTGEVKDDEVLDAGELVILDTDFLYPLDPKEKAHNIAMSEYVERLESMYQSELNFYR